MRQFGVWMMVIVLVAGPGSLALADGEKPNLVANPGLEMDADGDNIPDHWGVPKPSDYPADWRVGGGAAECGISDIARSGEHSIVYSVAAPTFPTVAPDDRWDYAAWEETARFFGGHWAIAFKTADFPVEEYHLYRVRCWVKAQNVMTLHIKFIATYVYPRQDKPVIRWTHPLLHDPAHTMHKSGTWDWELWEQVIAVPEFVEKGRIEFWVREWPAPAELYCDDMTVTDEGPYPFFIRRREQLEK